MGGGNRGGGQWVRVRATDAPLARGPRLPVPARWVRTGHAPPVPVPPPTPAFPSAPSPRVAAAVPGAGVPVVASLRLVAEPAEWAEEDDEEIGGWLEPSFDVSNPWVGRRRR
ncbi:hypothetical protein LX15_003117 [Streptoalloteichus tenebrarius]|uniref:Uncharacterized protein n=1 Tax=Streptoalloteichus tenebrarius (strain ATCC 17920 / DSM 40477 / JCM 4838 / CBS 697.72 / NBRC 16177 / NCIMB 11028 / NRRL B-12390 / A12253. 1 / ISP 5477) TaxID=1933 RepID=A0ABT1HV96_STRSD|nr:hypothetical protein [Streptoalloteichus tenebrarius]MCP2259416.1 hypothetical protein [Streptoalloteichus tenebrarius]BFF02359.1 hypothetical protein GCM10020241_40340 [Streptoalloteichus tenebrarius]